MFYLDFLAEVHRRLTPRRYLEIGVRWGHSLALSRCSSVGVDPAFAIDQELHAEVHLFRTTADEYFSRPDPLAPVGGEPFDLVFIDGMHLVEYALRDFTYAERCAAPASLIVFDDVFPRNVTEAARVRVTGDWTGDIYSLLPVLERYRPDLLTIPVDTAPTGLLLVTALDPTDDTLREAYDAIIAEHRRPDPQPVPEHLLRRTVGQPPQRVLDSGILELLATVRTDSHADAGEQLHRLARSRFGPAYGNATTRG